MLRVLLEVSELVYLVYGALSIDKFIFAFQTSMVFTATLRSMY